MVDFQGHLESEGIVTTCCEVWTKDQCFSKEWRHISTTAKFFRHPAKFSFGVIERIILHLKELGVVRKDDIVLDPFGGVGCGGFLCAREGLRWVGVELEDHFVEEGERMFARYERGWKERKLPLPRLVRGDSRRLVRHLPECGVIVSGPPSGDLVKDTGVNEGTGAHGEKHRRGRKRASSDQTYGHSRGQLADFPAAVVSSPPYETLGLAQVADPENRARRMRARGFSEADIRHAVSNAMKNDYGNSAGQLSKMSPDSFWEAAREVVGQCYKVLRPGGVAVWNTKDFVRGGRRVQFSDDWEEMCRECGFVSLCRHLVMLVKKRKVYDLFGSHVEVTDRKSFFKRLNESKGSPKIDWEDVICMTKPRD